MKDSCFLLILPFLFCGLFCDSQKIATDGMESMELLPADWQRIFDDLSQKFYYWNNKTHESTWNKPLIFDFHEIDDPDDLLSGVGIDRFELKQLNRDETDGHESEDEIDDDKDVVLPLLFGNLHS